VADRISDLLHSERLTIERSVHRSSMGLLHESRYSLSLNLWPCSKS
jgi:hypothetical protein